MASAAATPTATVIPLLPTTGGGPQGGSGWLLPLIAGGIGALAVGLTIRRRRMPKTTPL
jgi:hypothetical protein